MRITQVNTADISGGAEKVAYHLHLEYGRHGHESSMVVGVKKSSDPQVFCFDHQSKRGPWERALRMLGKPGPKGVVGITVGRIARVASNPSRGIQMARGWEDFEFPDTWNLLEKTPLPPNLVHLHNLHGGYFDPRFLPELSSRVPTVLTMHDIWLLTGHCAHSVDGDRWETGCEQCPHLDFYPAIARDAANLNLQRKSNVYSRSKFFVASPARWVLENVERSALHQAVIESRVIPYGVDHEVFHPGDKKEARERVKLPEDTWILMCAANGIVNNVWKDFRTMREAIARVAERMSDQKVMFLALGEDRRPETIGRAEIVFRPFIADDLVVADYYRASDVYVHAALADTFPTSILEAMATGTPVVATAVGGIPEQVNGLGARGYKRRTTQAPTGILVSPGDTEAMAEAIVRLLTDTSLSARLSTAATEDSLRRFKQSRHVSEYLQWYSEILETFTPASVS